MKHGPLSALTSSLDYQRPQAVGRKVETVAGQSCPPLPLRLESLTIGIPGTLSTKQAR